MRNSQLALSVPLISLSKTWPFLSDLSGLNSLSKLNMSSCTHVYHVLPFSKKVIRGLPQHNLLGLRVLSRMKNANYLTNTMNNRRY